MYYLYQIRNRVTEYKYIGCSKNIKKRWNEHKKDLSKNNHHCIHLQRAWNKYGADVFEFEILQEFSSEDHMYLSEIKLIESTDKKYNVSPGGTGGDLSKNRTDEQRKKTAELRREANRKRYEKLGEREKCNSWKDLTEEEREERRKKWVEVKLGRNNKSFKNDKQVRQINKNTGELIKVWEDSWSAGYYGGFTSEYIVKCCNKHPKYKSHKGFIWEWGE